MKQINKKILSILPHYRFFTSLDPSHLILLYSSQRMTTITTTPTNLQPFPFLVKDKSSQRAISNLHRSLRQGKLKGPEHVALATARAMRHVVSAAKFNDLDQLVEIIKEAGREAQRGQIREQTVGNITRRILHLLREEAKALLLESEQEEINNPDSTSISTSKEANTSNNININQNSGFSTPGIGFSSPSSSRILSPPTSNVSTPGGSSFHHHQFSKRPSGPNRTETFQSGSFSIADLVAAGSQSNSNNNARTPGSGQSPSNVSGSNTPSNNNNHHGLSRDSSGFFDKFALSSISSQSENLDDDDEEEQIEDEEDEEDEEDGDGDFSEDDEEEEKSKSKNEKDQKTSFNHQLKPVLIQAIQELIDELETVRENIAKDARDHVHSGEVILTLGHSETVLAFLKAAAKDRKFTVIVAETAPSFSGHLTASALSSSSLGISVILVPDSSIFALLPRVSKVLLGAHSVLANGGLLSNPGSITCASAAKLNSTPVVILSGVYKICPDWTWIGGDLNHMIGTTSGGNSSQVIGFDDQIFNSNGDGGAYGDEDEEGSGLELVNPLWDYIPPNLVDVFITNVGEHPPSYVYRLIKENYAEQDLGEL